MSNNQKDTRRKKILTEKEVQEDLELEKRIITIREAKKISKTEIAQKLEIELPHYYRLEKRGKELSLRQLEKIAAALGVSVQYLLFGEEQKDCKECEERIKELEQKLKLIEQEKNILQEKLKLIYDRAKLNREKKAETLAMLKTLAQPKHRWMAENIMKFIDYEKMMAELEKISQQPEKQKDIEELAKDVEKYMESILEEWNKIKPL
ncbi:MAG: helix-turn-helix transcriptional regulator [Raineya sp.]|nr:helix-turn-helix transcriptional regulator [Raineya sp.]